MIIECHYLVFSFYVSIIIYNLASLVLYNGYWIQTPKFWWWIWNRVGRIVSYHLFYAKPSLIIPLILVACWLWWGINVISLKAKFVEATWHLTRKQHCNLDSERGAWSISRPLVTSWHWASVAGASTRWAATWRTTTAATTRTSAGGQDTRIHPRPIIYLSIFIYKTSASLGRRQGEADWRGRCRSGTCRRPAPAPPPASTRPRPGTSTGRRPRPRQPPASTPRHHTM